MDNAWLLRARPDEPLPLPHLVATPAQAMRLFLAGLRERFGGVEAYALSAGVPASTIEALRAGLLTD